MKKKILSILSVILVLLSVVSLAACGKTYSDIKWPTSGIAAKLPKPESTKGEIISDSDDYFNANIAETSKEAFNNYVDAVKEKGFTVDYNRSDTSYMAEDKEGNDVSLFYEDGDIMSVSISNFEEVTDSPEDLSEMDAILNETEEPKTEAKAEKEKSNSSSVSPDFKDTMDSYESFMNEYVDFMKKYNSSGDVTSILSDYTNYLSKYTELVNKINAIDQSSLSEADAAYYLEVTSRVAKKLAEVGQ